MDRFARGLALFTDKEEDARMKRVGYCNNAPSYVLANPGRFHYMLSRDPVTGSFSDYADHFGNRTDVVGNFQGEWTVRTFEDPDGKILSLNLQCLTLTTFNQGLCKAQAHTSGQ